MKRIGLYLFIIGITFIKAYGQEDSGPVNTGAANYLTIPVDARSAAMGGAGVAISRGNNAVFHNGAATLSEAMHKGGVTYTYSPWMRDYESGYSLHSLGGFYKINKRNAILLGFRYFGYPEMDGIGEDASGIHPKEIAVVAGYAYEVIKNLSVSATFKYLYSDMGKIGNRSKGIILIIISAFGFAMMSAFVKLAGDLPSFQKTFFRNLVSCFVAMFFIIKHKLT